MNQSYIDVECPLGTLRLVAGGSALTELRLPVDLGPAPAPAEASGRDPATLILRAAARQLDEYFAGRRQIFDLPLDLRGTEFQRAAWNALRTIPFGETRSYGQQARAIARPTAFRAVGAANGRNPIAIIVPCHRVIGSDGGLTGYGGGEPAKRWLLEHERRGAAGASRATPRAPSASASASARL